MERQKIKLRNHSVEITYISKGNGDITLLFLHGWCINSTYFSNQMDYFSSDFKVYALDLPGFGESTALRDNWTIEEYANDVMAFIDQLDLQNIIIIGHSLSGEIMLEIALKNSPRIIGLVGIDNFKIINVEFTPDQMEQMNTMMQKLHENFKVAAPNYADFMLFHETTSPEVRKRIKSDFAATKPTIGFSALQNLIFYSSNEPAKLEQLNLKLHLLNSDSNPTNENGLKNHCHMGYAIYEIEATGHYPMLEKPTEFNLILEELLRNVLTTLN